MATEVDLGLKEIQQLLDDENKNEEEFQVHFILHKIRQACHDLMYDKSLNSDKKRTAIFIFIAPAYSRVRYRSSNFRPSVRSFVRSFVRPFVRPSTFTSKLSFLDISYSCESETLHSNCP